MKNLLITALCLAVITAVATLIHDSKQQTNYSELVLSNIQALTTNENDTVPKDEICTGICVYQPCYDKHGNYAGLAICSTYKYKRESVVEACTNYQECDCPLGTTGGIEIIISNHKDCLTLE